MPIQIWQWMRNASLMSMYVAHGIVKGLMATTIRSASLGIFSKKRNYAITHR